MRLSILFLLIAVSLFSGPPDAEGPKVSIESRTKPAAPAARGPRSDIRVDTTLVLVPVHVTDPLNVTVTGLEKDNFRLLEDRVEQEIVSFNSEDAPLSIGLVFDNSGSMENKMAKARQAVGEFLKTANPQDEFFMVRFNDRPELVEDFTLDTSGIQNRLVFTEARGRTSLLDAVYLALHKMKKARNPRRALLIISDGGDNSSRYTETEIRNLVREADVQIFAIGIFEPFASRGRSAEELGGPGLLNELAQQTGGRHFPVENLNDLPDIAAKIGIALRNQYVLGFAPINKERDGKYRKLQVKLVPPKGLPPLKAYWRVGYYAPIQ